jgi:hypothetical protein
MPTKNERILKLETFKDDSLKNSSNESCEECLWNFKGDHTFTLFQEVDTVSP